MFYFRTSFDISKYNITLGYMVQPQKPNNQSLPELVIQYLWDFKWSRIPSSLLRWGFIPTILFYRSKLKSQGFPLITKTQSATLHWVLILFPVNTIIFYKQNRLNKSIAIKRAKKTWTGKVEMVSTVFILFINHFRRQLEFPVISI